MRGAEDVLNRLKFDESLHPIEEWTVVWEDRFSGDQENSLEFFYEEEIPLHRIRQFKRGAEIMWDRRLKKDLIFTAQKSVPAYKAVWAEDDAADAAHRAKVRKQEIELSWMTTK